MNFRDELTKLIGGEKDYSTSPLMLSYDSVAKDTLLKQMPSEKWKLLDILKRKEIHSLISKKNIKVVNSIPDKNLTQVMDLVKSKIQPDAAKSEKTTPVPEETAPAPEETAPVPEEIAPAPEETAPVSEEIAPVSEETAPVSEETAPVSEETAPVSEETAPVPEETAPAPEETAPAPEETAPAPEETAPQHDLDLTPNFVNVFFEYVNDLMNATPQKSADEKNTPTSAMDFSNPANFETKKENDAVPDGWEKHVSKNSDPGKSYYVNKKTGETTWEKPTSNTNSSASVSEKSSDSLPDGWTAHVSENTKPGETYYYNEKTDQTVWEKPTTNTSSSASESEKSSDSLPDGWTAHVSENTRPGETYYYNEKTDQTVWEKPTSNTSSSSSESEKSTSNTSSSSSESEKSSKSSDSLPDGWTAHVSENTKPGETYYYNEKTDQTVWEKPTTNTSSSASESEKLSDSSDSLPDGWTAHVSENTKPGETYYYNEKTDQTVWEKPTTNTSSSASESEKSSEKALKAPIAGKCYKCGNSNNLKLKTYKLEKDKAAPVYFCCFKCFEGIEF